jgi:hypothetical protein
LTNIYCPLEEKCSDDDDEDEDDNAGISKQTGRRKKGERKKLLTLDENKSGSATIPLLDRTPTRAILEGVIRSVVTHGYRTIYFVF